MKLWNFDHVGFPSFREFQHQVMQKTSKTMKKQSINQVKPKPLIANYKNWKTFNEFKKKQQWVTRLSALHHITADYRQASHRNSVEIFMNEVEIPVEETTRKLHHQSVDKNLSGIFSRKKKWMTTSGDLICVFGVFSLNFSQLFKTCHRK